MDFIFFVFSVINKIRYIVFVKLFFLSGISSGR